MLGWFIGSDGLVGALWEDWDVRVTWVGGCMLGRHRGKWWWDKYLEEGALFRDNVQGVLRGLVGSDIVMVGRGDIVNEGNWTLLASFQDLRDVSN